VGNLRRIGAKKLHAWGLAVLADDAQLLISELVTNGLRHGTGHQIVFRLVIGVDMLVMEVDDGSPGRPEVRDASFDEENGRGMFLIDALAASWGVSADGTRTWCTLTKPEQKPTSR
jgi:anti-sigma regulatory factor (Ser/Thr protein kinase)